MGKTLNPLENDFEQLATRAQETVRLLASDENEEQPRIVDPTKQEKEAKEPTSRPVVEYTTPPPIDICKQSAVHSQSNQWGPPIALLNTRIPERIADCLEDLLYKLKKQKIRPATKQALVIEALEDLLRKHDVLS